MEEEARMAKCMEKDLGASKAKEIFLKILIYLNSSGPIEKGNLGSTQEAHVG